MLTALEDGVKGGVWFSLIDKVYHRTNLWSSWASVARNAGAAGVDHVTVKMYEESVEENLSKLGDALRTQTYVPQAIRRVHIPKPGTSQTRPLGIPTVRDRIVQRAICNVIEPIFERDFAPHSYGFRPGRGCKDALRRVEHLLKSGHRHVVDADLKSYFDTIPHAKLMEKVRAKIADGRVLALIESFLKQGVMEGLSQWTPSAGAPQGAVLSPLLSNIYLDELDQLMARLGYEMVRYADDFVILCRTREQAEAALAEVKRWTEQAGLTLHPEKTRLADAESDGFEFLGYRFAKGRRYPRCKSQARLRETIRSKTWRTDGRSLRVIIMDVNRTLRGWFEYFKHSSRNAFAGLDGWIRMRMRSILRKRRKGRGRGRGRDHQRWPNAFFAAQELMSMHAAHVRARQSARAATR
jgi:RNA-directed DNA polymerase